MALCAFFSTFLYLQRVFLHLKVILIMLNSCKNVSFLYVWMISNLIYYHIYTVWIKLCFIKEVWHSIFQVKQLFSLWIQLCNKQTKKQTKNSTGKFADYKCSYILLEKGGGQGLCNLAWVSSHSTQLACNSALVAHDWVFLRSDYNT